MSRRSAPWAVLALSLVTPGSTWAGPRWPTWPTEVDRVAAPLSSDERGPGAERDRLGALSGLESFATPVIEAPVVAAIDDRSSAVRREALRICWLREMTACIPAASRIWGNGTDPTLRVAALRVLSLDPDPSRLALLLGALRDPSDELRAQTAQLLGWAPLDDHARTEVRNALLAKLSDSASGVRRRAVEALGLLGPGPGTLAIARLLDDPEPTVRSAAATALARIRDPRAAPALLRAIDAPNEAVVAQAILDALALVPGEDVPATLLRKLDDPPEGLTAYRVAEAIGLRPDPEPALIRGLIARLREPELRRPTLRALLLLGEPTQSALQEALARGLDPALELEVERLLTALDLPERAARRVSSWPKPDDVQGWREALATGSESDRVEAARVLAERAPAWLGVVARRRIELADRPESFWPWLLAVALTSSPPDLGEPWLPWAKLVGWALDVRLTRSERCAALAVLGRTPSTAAARVSDELQPLLSEPDAAVRACFALSAGTLPGDPAASSLLLADRNAKVRAAAALSLAGRTGSSARTRMQVMAVADPDARVRAAARHATAEGLASPGTPPTFVDAEPPPYGWSEPLQWIEVRTERDRVFVPAVGSTRIRWALVPALTPVTSP